MLNKSIVPLQFSEKVSSRYTYPSFSYSQTEGTLPLQGGEKIILANGGKFSDEQDRLMHFAIDKKLPVEINYNQEQYNDTKRTFFVEPNNINWASIREKAEHVTQKSSIPCPGTWNKFEYSSKLGNIPMKNGDKLCLGEKSGELCSTFSGEQQKLLDFAFDEGISVNYSYAEKKITVS